MKLGISPQKIFCGFAADTPISRVSYPFFPDSFLFVIILIIKNVLIICFRLQVFTLDTDLNYEGTAQLIELEVCSRLISTTFCQVWRNPETSLRKEKKSQKVYQNTNNRHCRKYTFWAVLILYFIYSHFFWNPPLPQVLKFWMIPGGGVISPPINFGEQISSLRIPIIFCRHKICPAKKNLQCVCPHFLCLLCISLWQNLSGRF